MKARNKVFKSFSRPHSNTLFFYLMRIDVKRLKENGLEDRFQSSKETTSQDYCLELLLVMHVLHFPGHSNQNRTLSVEERRDKILVSNLSQPLQLTHCRFRFILCRLPSRLICNFQNDLRSNIRTQSPGVLFFPQATLLR